MRKRWPALGALVMAGLAGVGCGGGDGGARPASASIDDSAGKPQLRAAGGFFVDPAGAVVMLRGVNVAGNSKLPPYIPVANPDEFDALPPLGINVLRLLFTWEAYEPSPAIYDNAYLEKLAQIADAAWQRGIYVIIDFHQDGFSRYVAGGCGEGFPIWATSPSVGTEEPDNGPRCAHWAVKVALSWGMHQSFSDFYKNTDGVRSRYLRVLQRLAARFAASPGVIGYDLLNEPWGDEARELAPLYADAAAAIRAADPTAILFIEGQIATNSGLQTSLPRPAFDNFAYAPHYYDPVALSTGIWSRLSQPTNLAFSNMRNQAAAWGVPLFVGEYGMSAPANGAAGYMTMVYEKLDDSLASGAQWNWDPGWTPTAKDGWNREDLSIVDNTGALRANFQLRPFARRTAGVPGSFSFRDGVLDYTWQNESALGKTELFAPAALFGGAPRAFGSDGVACAYDATDTLVFCTAPSGLVKLEIRPG